MEDVGHSRTGSRDPEEAAVNVAKRGVKRVVWADEVGEELRVEKRWLEESFAHFGRSVNPPGKGLGTSERGDGKVERPALKANQETRTPGKVDIGWRRVEQGGRSYKEALLLHQPKQAARYSTVPSCRGSPAAKRKNLVKAKEAGRCFRCLARGHGVAECRDPVRCRACWCLGHRAKLCKWGIREGVKSSTMNPIREHRRRERPASLKAFIPYTEEYIRRSDLRQNAMLVDVVQPEELGLAPQQTLANALARRFGGYSHDFFVARYSEHDFVIILPGWVSAETLIRRHLVTLEAIWLRCYSWGHYWNARNHRTPFVAWIQLRNVPFECWTTPRIASMVSGFGRFIRADENSRNMSDLRAYRCRIAVDDVREIPHRLSIVMGDEIIDIHVHLESSERIRAGGDDHPPPPAPGGPHEGGRGGDGIGGRREEGMGEAGEGADEVDEGAEATELDRGSGISVNRGTARERGEGVVLVAARGGGTTRSRCGEGSAASASGSVGSGGRLRGPSGMRQIWAPRAGRRGVDRGPSATAGVCGAGSTAGVCGAGSKAGAASGRVGSRAQRAAGLGRREPCSGVGARVHGGGCSIPVGGACDTKGGRGGVASKGKWEMGFFLGRGGEGSSPKAVGEETLLVVGGLGGVSKTWKGDGGRGGICLAFNARGCMVVCLGMLVDQVWEGGGGVGTTWRAGKGVRLVVGLLGPIGLGPLERMEAPLLGTEVGGPGGVDLGCDVGSSSWCGGQMSISIAADGDGVQECLCLGEPTVLEGGAGDVRCSPRLAAKQAAPILLKAKALRARREEVVGCGGGRRTTLNRKKTQIRSGKCGVLLNEAEADSFMEFASHKV